MRFISALVAGALAVVAAAQSGNQANPFTNDNFNGIEAGESFTVTWDPTTDGTVTLQLVQGDPDSLNTVSTIEGAFASFLPSLTAFPLCRIDLHKPAVERRVTASE